MVYDFKDYRVYLHKMLEQGKERGARARLAKHLGCQQSYLSRILSQESHLSPEQAHAASEFFGHKKDEARYFFTLVQFNRAGSEALKKTLREQLQEMNEARLLLKNRQELPAVLGLDHQATYYSAWYYSAVHILLTIPKTQTPEAISKYLGLSQKRVMEILEFLVGVGLASRSHGRYKAGKTRIHLDQDSPLASKSHANWRMQAIQSLENQTNSDLHYSSVVSMNEEDLPAVREILVKAIENIREVVRASEPEETLICYAFDLFPVGNRL